MTIDIDKVIDERILTALEPLANGYDQLQQQLGNIKPPDLSDELEKIADRAREIALQAAKQSQPIEVKQCGDPEKAQKISSPHWALGKIARIMDALPVTYRNLYLYGESGGGKSTVARQYADSIGAEFHQIGLLTSEYKVTGFIDAQGRVVDTNFRKAWLNGGVVCGDEFDRWNRNAVIILNNALATGELDFPDGTYQRHEKCIVIFTGNTNLRGATERYQAAMSQDASVIDRLAFFHVGYDEGWEQATFADNPSWTLRVQRIRREVENQGLQSMFIVTPRAMIAGSRLLATGEFSQAEIEDMLIWRDGSRDGRERVINAVGKASRSQNKVINYTDQGAE